MVIVSVAFLPATEYHCMKVKPQGKWKVSKVFMNLLQKEVSGLKFQEYLSRIQKYHLTTELLQKLLYKAMDGETEAQKFKIIKASQSKCKEKNSWTPSTSNIPTTNL